MIHLHETKRKKSYFGGLVVSFRMEEFPEYPRSKRAIFQIEPKAEGKGVSWPKGSGVRDWTTGVIGV